MRDVGCRMQDAGCRITSSIPHTSSACAVCGLQYYALAQGFMNVRVLLRRRLCVGRQCRSFDEGGAVVFTLCEIFGNGGD